MNRALRIPLLAATLFAAAPGAAKESGQAELARAIKLFDDFEDRRASAALIEILDTGASPALLAKAHAYLGLIALNALKVDRARAEFKQALAIDATTELPFDAAPKARLAFDQVRHELEQEVQPEPPARTSPAMEAPPPAEPVAPKPLTEPKPKAAAVGGLERPRPAPGPDYTSAVVAGSIGVAALIAGAVCGVVSASTLRQAKEASDEGVANRLTTQAGTEGLSADVLFGVGGVGVAVGLVLLVLDARSGRVAHAAVRAHANGVSIAF